MRFLNIIHQNGYFARLNSNESNHKYVKQLVQRWVKQSQNLKYSQFSIKFINKTRMSEFDEYLLDDIPTKSPRASKYVVIDSDEQYDHFSQYVVTSGPPSSHGALSKIDTNLPDSNVNKKWVATEQGTINKHLKNKKEQKSIIDSLKLDINKVQSECRALQQLIEKIIKQEAELQVKKHNLMRQQKRQPRKSIKKSIKKQKTEKQNYISSFSQRLDISKTIKTFSSKIR